MSEWEFRGALIAVLKMFAKAIVIAALAKHEDLSIDDAFARLRD